MQTQDRTELSRVAVDGVDPNDGSRVEVIGIRSTDGLMDLYVPSASHTVRLDAHAVATLATAMSPHGPATITVVVESQTGEFTIIPAEVAHGREISDKSITGLMAALQATRSRLRSFGWAPPRRAKKTA